ncbi:MAG: hypothetical protein KF830_16435 [Planctomycetes bacterium]|nr:hypothetical protein [Planctomycetota bacterium]
MDLPLHPKIVHLPIALAVLLPLLSSGLLLAVWRNWLPQRAWALVVVGQLLLVGSGVLALRSGESDEDRVERLVPEAALEAHEEAGERFVWAGGTLLVLSLLPLLLRSPRARLAAGAATFAGTLAVLGLGYQVGQKGGELVYRHGAAAAFTAPAGSGGAAPAPRGDADDDR